MSPVRAVPALGALALAAVLVITLTGCGSTSDEVVARDRKDDGRIFVVASTDVWGSVAERVGGNAVTVESMIKNASGDPHAQPDRPSDAVVVADADVVIYNGGGYDESFSKLVDSVGVRAPRIDAFELSGHGDEHGGEHGDEHGDEHEDEGGASGGEEARDGHGEETQDSHGDDAEDSDGAGDSHGDGHGHEHGAVNEHVWYDLPTVGTVADALAEEFTVLAPDKRATFTANAAAFNTELDGLLAKAADIGKANPGAKVLATEPVATYLLDAAGLTDVTPAEFSEAVEEETDPPLAVVAETSEMITNREVRALINNAQTETPVTNYLKNDANDTGIPVVDVTETLPEGVHDYVEWINAEVDALADALGTS